VTVTQTPRLGINQWGSGGDPFTRSQVDADNAKLELLAAIDVQGTHAARPASGTRGRYYYETDTGFLCRDTGSAWVVINPAFPTVPTIGGAAPTSSAPADAAAEGSDGRGARLDHKHGRESAGAPTSSAPGDTGATGTGSAIALALHKHARENHGLAEHNGLGIDAGTLGSHAAAYFAAAADLSTEVTNRTNAVSTEAADRTSADSSEASTRTTEDHKRPRMFAVDAGHVGGTPALSVEFLEQAGTRALTSDGVAGIWELDFPTAFPNGLLWIEVQNGDRAAAQVIPQLGLTYALDHVRGILTDLGGTIQFNTTFRLNWRALGW
jgi:hypothetical protein